MMVGLSDAIQEYNDDQLLHYLKEETINNSDQEEVMQMMKWINPNGNKISCTSLQLTLYQNRSKEVIFKLIDIGGRELVMVKNERKSTALHIACWNTNPSFDIVSKLMEVGGREPLMVQNQYGDTALHYACRNENASMDIISKLIDVGGRELVMVNGQCGDDTALHVACANENASFDIISKLIEVGGRELLIEKNSDGNTALNGYFNPYRNNRRFTLDYGFTSLLKEYILANVGGEFGMGGLFDFATQRVQNKIYQKWDQLSPALQSVVESLQDQQQPPILHAAILVKAPLNVIQNIINQFQYSVLKTDSLGRYPIVVALEEGLEWSKGLQQVVEATAVAQQRLSIYSAAQYGIKWTHYMKELTDLHAEDIMDSHDNLTGLRLFMVAAMGDHYDLSGIYGIMRMNPETNINDI